MLSGQSKQHWLANRSTSLTAETSPWKTKLGTTGMNILPLNYQDLRVATTLPTRAKTLAFSEGMDVVPFGYRATGAAGLILLNTFTV